MSHQGHALSAVVVKDDSAKDDSPKSCFDVPADVPPVRGNPGPFGLLCFGMTTCMLMFVETTWASTSFIPVVYCYAAFYGGLGQFVAGILEIIRGNTFAGTAFSSYGCFWMGWFLNKFLGKPSDATGQALWCGLWAFLTLGFFVVTLRKNGGLQTIFSTLTLCFILLAGGQFSHSCMLAGGYVGFFCGSSAIYTAFAELYEIELGFKLPGLQKTNYI